MTAPDIAPAVPLTADAPASPLLLARDLTRRFGSTLALRGVSLSLASGERVALLGPNGAGKTTLIRILATALRPTAGHLAIGGYDASRSSRAARMRVGLVGHQTFLYGDLTVRENLRFYGRLYGVSELTDRIQEISALAGADSFLDRPVRVLSRGMQQRASLARALIHDPSVLLLDEPETGLDDMAQMALSALLKTWSARGRAVLFSSHRLEWMQSLAERAIILQGGAIAEDVSLGAEVDLVAHYRALIGTP
jgi:ABC-type multidrug transport system ATPase subunit